MAEPVPAVHTSIVLIDRLDTAAARALRAARTLRADRTEAVHFCLDEHRTERLRADWDRFRIDHLDLRVVECPDRKLVHRVQELAHELTADGRTQLSVLIPHLLHRRRWHRLLHDRTSNALAVALAKLPNVSVTLVPYQLGEAGTAPLAPVEPDGGDGSPAAWPTAVGEAAPLRRTGGDGAQPIRELEWRRPAVVEGRVEQLVVETTRGVPSLVAVVDDGSGRVDLLFLGRHRLGGVELGTRLRATGTAAAHRGRLTILNPMIELLTVAHH